VSWKYHEPRRIVSHFHIWCTTRGQGLGVRGERDYFNRVAKCCILGRSFAKCVCKGNLDLQLLARARLESGNDIHGVNTVAIKCCEPLTKSDKDRRGEIAPPTTREYFRVLYCSQTQFAGLGEKQIYRFTGPLQYCHTSLNWFDLRLFRVTADVTVTCA